MLPSDLNIFKNSKSKITEEIYKHNLELFREKERFQNLLYEVSEGVIVVNEKMEISVFNHSAEKMFIISKDRALGRHIDDIALLFDDKTKTPIKLSLICFPKNEKHSKLEGVYVGRLEHEKYANVKTTKIVPEKGDPECIITITDITQERRLAKEKDEFLSITSHELKTPMSIIKSYIWMLQEEKGGKLSEKQREYLMKAMRGAERMVVLINDMLNVQRIEQGRMEFRIEKFDAAPIIVEVLDELDIKAKEKDLQLEFKPPKEPIYIYADRQKYREILLNLAGNAVKYTDSGTVCLAMECTGRFLKINITDTGRGIAEEDIAKLFHKFQRLDATYSNMAESGGTGLGLYIVKLYISMMGGSVGVQSPGRNKGSTFWVTFPMDKTAIPTN